MCPDLLVPLPEALAHSERLAAYIRQQMIQGGGAIPFSRFMELALYAPGLGYYSAGATKFGEAGDFITAPELGPLFATTVADALVPVLQQLGALACVLELGGGSGTFAEMLLKRLMELKRLPRRYAILEPSAELRQRQQTHLEHALTPSLFALVEWVDGPFSEEWHGVVFANEVIDALPASRFTVRDGEVYEETVVLDAQRSFACGQQPADTLLTEAVRHIERDLSARFADGYCSEVLPQLPYWVQAVAGGLKRGVLLFVDYGYPRSEYYHPQREDGTLRAFYRHRVHDDWYRWPGLQDLTASVDFTALAEAGTSAGFDLAGYCTQASFLLSNGLDQSLATAEAGVDEVGKLQLRNQVKRLTLPTEMGERFQVMGFTREVTFDHAFLIGDLRWRL
ncbi:MAG TPA: class I SAM-dependent methyltransferase [Xylella taiwanensis]